MQIPQACAKLCDCTHVDLLLPTEAIAVTVKSQSRDNTSTNRVLAGTSTTIALEGTGHPVPP